MLEQLIAVDKEFFLGINQGMSNVVFDWLMPVLRNMFTWFPLYLFIIIFCVRNYRVRGVVMVAFFFINFGISDWLSSSVVKNSVQRLRPCNDIEFKEEINLRVRCGGGYSFTSSHAANHFALAMLLSTMFYRRWKPVRWAAPMWAASIGFAQIYVGVHYPGDVLFGSLLGILVGLTVGSIYKKVDAWLVARSENAQAGGGLTS